MCIVTFTAVGKIQFYILKDKKMRKKIQLDM